MQNIDYGNMVTWKKEIPARPTMMNFLQRNNIDPNNPYAVRNILERRRQNVMKYINTKIDQAESILSQQHGRPIKVKDLHPYEIPGATPSTPDVAPWSPEP